MGIRGSLRNYYSLTKPGIVRGNMFVAIAGFLLGSHENIILADLSWLIIGLSLVIASACVFNNCIDRAIDKDMKRTSNRALVTGQISTKSALIYGGVLGILGHTILAIGNNYLSSVIAFVGFFFYVVVYSIWWKRASVHGTLIGSISGAIPPVAGYTAATGSLDSAALILFLIMVAWQMPHFYSIAIFRQKEYEQAGVPVMPSVWGIKKTLVSSMVFVVAFIFISPLLTIAGYTGVIYLTVISILGLIWAWIVIKGFNTMDNITWAKQNFYFSLIVLTSMSAVISLNSILP